MKNIPSIDRKSLKNEIKWLRKDNMKTILRVKRIRYTDIEVKVEDKTQETIIRHIEFAISVIKECNRDIGFNKFALSELTTCSELLLEMGAIEYLPTFTVVGYIYGSSELKRYMEEI